MSPRPHGVAFTKLASSCTILSPWDGHRGYLTGMPGPRGWYANLRAHPRFTVHVKHGVTADLPATAAPVDEQARRRVITAVLDLQNRPEIAARVGRRQDLDDWLARSPLVEIVFDDERLRTTSSARSGWSEPRGEPAQIGLGQDVEALSSQAVYPPLESITAPVIYEAAGLARNVMTGAVSAGSLTRWMARADTMAWRASGLGGSIEVLAHRIRRHQHRRGRGGDRPGQGQPLRRVR